MTQAFIFPDPMLAVLDVLRPALAASAAPEAQDVTVGTKAPLPRDLPPLLPFVLVRSDGAGVESRVVEAATIRVAVWHRSEALGLALAQRVRAILLAHRGETIVSVTPLTGPIPTSDPDSGAPLTYLTLSVRTRPTETL